MTSVEEALATLRSMFEVYDEDTLLAVLEANEGHMERTVDVLLAMQDDNVAAASDTAAASGTQPLSLPPAAPFETGRVASAQNLIRSRGSLPDDFLRVPTGVDQEAQDRMLAEMLQNEIFRDEIQADGDITTYIGADGRRHQAQPPEKSAYDVANETMVAVGEPAKNKISQMYARFQASRHASDPT
ncbi:hypothetical protein DYB38_010717 [Aphanomyces astaci]|uniref:CUE domain-containing protein n=1 Tax=Aphanomyces astaci TaxID=112090 RepID=A0A397CN31_APHAT|nr:hypothetical protein DYB36_011344 [Aphanomyces astaci]RHY37347.1 hypothetical protein DYB34_011357 [Aphanomyces astaci]RHY46570.1 hypothetical protein DYB38_010717 [Aphanomyces astaci]RHZ19010.1 hypothetical protein DYB31_004843 [Aphanomyces astaci]